MIVGLKVEGLLVPKGASRTHYDVHVVELGPRHETPFYIGRLGAKKPENDLSVTLPTSSGGKTLDSHHNGSVSRRQWSFKTDAEGKVFLVDHDSNAGTFKNGVRITQPRTKTKPKPQPDKTEIVEVGAKSEAAGPANFELAHGDVVSTASALHAVVDLDGSLAHLKDSEKFREYLAEKVRPTAH